MKHSPSVTPPAVLLVHNLGQILHTTIQEHLDSRWEAVDPGLDSLEGLLVRNRVGGPSEHHQAMLDERNEVSESRFARVDIE